MRRALRPSTWNRPLNNVLTPLGPRTRQLAETSRTRQLAELAPRARLHAGKLFQSPFQPLPLRSSAPWPCHATQQHRGLSSSSPPSQDEDKNKKKPTRWEQIKTTFREHGKVFILYYTTTWLGGFGVAFGGVTLAGLDGVAALQWLGADAVIDTSQFSTRVVNALIAAEINELFEFVRLPLVIATTPALSRRLRGGGAATVETEESVKDEKEEKNKK